MNRIVSIHTIDPRGTKVGGIETHVRQVLARHPADTRILLVGVDGRGDLELGKIVQIEVDGREIDFLPVMFEPEADMRRAATRLLRSLTLRFALACLRSVPLLRRVARDIPRTAEVQRSEFAAIAWLAGLPCVMLIHNEFTHKDRMDSLLKRYWWLFRRLEALSLRLSAFVYGVNPAIVARISAEYPQMADRIETLSVSVDTDVFRPAPFDTRDDVLRVVYAGRLDGFKDPALMFEVVRRLHVALNGRLEFHYAGGADPERFPEFAAIRACSVLHGALDQAAIARLLHHAHMGILTSYFEGMPCFLLEGLASGRPFTGLSLPQYSGLVVEGVSGHMCARIEDRAACADAVASKALELWGEIRNAAIQPAIIHAQTLPWSVHQQLGRLFARHRALASQGTPPGASAPTSSTRCPS